MSQPITPTVDPLRLSHCVGCAYALNGLPEVGVCPECGKPYGQETIVLYGWARGSHANIANASPRIVFWVCIPMGMIILGYLLPMIFGRKPSWALLIPLIPIGLLLWQRWTNPLPCLLQVRACPAGCVEIDHVALNAALKRKLSVAPWGQLDRIEIDRINGERYRLRIGKRPNWFGLAPALTVDAEVQCTDVQAEALRRRLIAWREDAAARVSTGGFPIVPRG